MGASQYALEAILATPYGQHSLTAASLQIEAQKSVNGHGHIQWQTLPGGLSRCASCESLDLDPVPDGTQTIAWNVGHGAGHNQATILGLVDSAISCSEYGTWMDGDGDGEREEWRLVRVRGMEKGDAGHRSRGAHVIESEHLDTVLGRPRRPERGGTRADGCSKIRTDFDSRQNIISDTSRAERRQESSVK